MRFVARAGLCCALLCATALPAQTIYRVDCAATGPDTLHSLDAVNRLELHPGDSVLFRRDTTCNGTLQPQGSGAEGHPILIGAYGAGTLPRIIATSQDPAAVLLFNQQYIEISSLDVSGSSTFGVRVSGDTGILHNITLHNLNVHDVRGNLKRKESGLIVIAPEKPNASFSGIHIESVRAFDTTQWSGIFVSGPSREYPAENITIRNAVVHDVQGDGIVLFNAKDSGIYHSLAWHTGMQHQQSIGTPNAIWTWQCDHCTVEGNEAFLVDSPGVDGGAFDIDWGNTSNTVRNNFGHDTVGYCVAIFGANGPTRDSVVDNNLCLHNGLSPRLAQRQGAILLMTWGTGSIEGATITHNLVDWHAAGDTPVVQTGSKLSAANVTLANNEFHTTGLQFIDSVLPYTGDYNRFLLEGATPAEQAKLKQQMKAKEPNALFTTRLLNLGLHPHGSAPGWHLDAFATQNDPQTANVLTLLKSAAVQYRHNGLVLTLSGDASVLQQARDALLEADGVQLKLAHPAHAGLVLIAPGRHMIALPLDGLSFSGLGMALRNMCGEPNYGRLPTLNVHATD